MDSYIISSTSNIQIPKEANIINIDEGLNFGALSNEFYYIDKSLTPAQKKAILEHLGLFASVTTFQKDDSKICLVSEAKFTSNATYKTSTNGSIANDELSHATLDVEKVARIAYEHTEHKLLNVDNADTFASSNIWRKVVNNINEDYEQVDLMNLLVEDFFIYFTNKYEELETIIVDPYYKNIVLKNIVQIGFKITESYYTNDFGIIAKLI